MRSPFDNSPPNFRQRLDRLVGDLNVLLAALAIGLAYLDFVVFATVMLSDEIRRQHYSRGDIALFDSPSVSSERVAPTRGAP